MGVNPRHRECADSVRPGSRRAYTHVLDEYCSRYELYFPKCFIDIFRTLGYPYCLLHRNFSLLVSFSASPPLLFPSLVVPTLEQGRSRFLGFGIIIIRCFSGRRNGRIDLNPWTGIAMGATLLLPPRKLCGSTHGGLLACTKS